MNMSRVKKILSKNLVHHVHDIDVSDATLSLVRVNLSFESLLLTVSVYSLAIGCFFIQTASRVIIVVYNWPKDVFTLFSAPIFYVKLMLSPSTVEEWATWTVLLEIVDSVRRMLHLLQGLHSVKLRLTVCQERRQSSHQKNEDQRREAVEVDEVKSYCPVYWCLMRRRREMFHQHQQQLLENALSPWILWLLLLLLLLQLLLLVHLLPLHLFLLLLLLLLLLRSHHPPPVHPHPFNSVMRILQGNTSPHQLRMVSSLFSSLHLPLNSLLNYSAHCVLSSSFSLFFCACLPLSIAPFPSSLPSCLWKQFMDKERASNTHALLSHFPPPWVLHQLSSLSHSIEQIFFYWLFSLYLVSASLIQQIWLKFASRRKSMCNRRQASFFHQSKRATVNDLWGLCSDEADHSLFSL